MMSLLVAWLISAAAADSVQPIIPGLQLNEKLRLIATDGFYKNDQVEVRIQVVQLPSAAVARKKAEAEIYNLQNLYKPRNNPYQGQVSELVECGKDLMPKTERIPIKGGGESTLLTGGVSARKTFGVCAPDEIAYWGGYFEFYHAPVASAVEVRLFLKKNAAANLAAGRAKLSRLSRELFR